MKCRVTLITGVAYSEDLDRAVEVIESALKKCDAVRQNEEIQMLSQAFGSSTIDIEVPWWTDPLPGDLRQSRGEVATSIKRALDDAGIEIPFPYRTLTFKEEFKPHVVSLDNDNRAEKIG